MAQIKQGEGTSKKKKNRGRGEDELKKSEQNHFK